MRTKTDYTKTRSPFRIISLLLCLCMVSGIFQAFTVLTYSASAPDVSVYCDGSAVKEVFLSQYEKKEAKAVCAVAESGLTFQWQVLIDADAGEWIDIYNATGEALGLSYALLSPALDAAGNAYVRCAATNSTATGYSSPVCVTVSFDAGESGSFDESSEAAQNGSQKGIGTLVADNNADGSESNPDENIISVSIRYLDAVAGLPIYTGFNAQINRGSAYRNTVVSPTYLGYKPYYNPENPAETDPDNCTVLASSIYVNIPEDYTGSSYSVNVYYKADDVSYAIKYFFQNINDDFYTENSALYRRGTAKTGTIIDNTVLALPEADTVGFIKLYHYPEAVAADGSTVFECYYDRNYSMLKFDTAGGYGTEPIYARYGTPFLVNEPTRHGYKFVGWDLLDANGSGDGQPDALPSTVPEESATYRALWQTVDTQYTVVYWLQNADDDDYSYIGSLKKSEQSGTTVVPADDLTAKTPVCGNTTHTHTDDCYPKNFRHYVYDSQKTVETNAEMVVKGDGSSVLNVYYTRKYYTLRFIYAKEFNRNYETVHDPSWVFSGIKIDIVGGSTYGFGNAGKAWPNGYGKDYTLDELFKNISTVNGGSDQWNTLYHTVNGELSEAEMKKWVPQLSSEAQGSGYYENGVIPSASSYNSDGDRYYYFDLTARYGADLTESWPVDIFDSINIASPFSKNGGNQHADNDGWGNYAYLAGWNGEFKVKYSLDNTNSTIKGLYQKLDDNLIFGADYEYGADRQIQATVNGKTVDSNLNYFVAFFNNGNFSWNVPRHWVYELYVPVFTDELTELGEEQINALKASKEPTVINGKTYYYYDVNDVVYRLYDRNETSDDGWYIGRMGSTGIREQQTQTSITGFAYAKGDPSYVSNVNQPASASNGKPRNTRSEFVNNGTLADQRESYTARFFYVREEFSLVMHSHNDIYYSKNNVEFDSGLDRYVFNADGTLKEPEYPSTLEKGAYVFAGWYTSPGCYDGTEYQPGMTMPASNLALYAKWAPKSYTVNFFRNYDEMLAYENGDTSVKILATRQVEHGEVYGNIDNPVDDFSGFHYTFGGWFYMKRSTKTAYTPLDIPVMQDLNVFADWGSLSAQPYTIHYALLEVETDPDWLALLQTEAGAGYQTNVSYPVTLNGEERSYVYLPAQDGEPAGFHREIADISKGYGFQGNTRTFYPKTGNPYYQLMEGFNEGYFPTLASHSFTIEYEENKASPERNVFTFTYVYATDISYHVQYKYLATGELISDVPYAGASGEVEKTTSLAVVTERFAVVTDYVPDAFYKRLILSVVKNSEGKYVGSPDNVVTFYYTQNTSKAYYAVHYMLQNLGAQSDDITAKNDDGSYRYFTESTTIAEGIGAVNGQISVTPPAFTGFTVLGSGYVKYGDTLYDISWDANGNFDITVLETGSELYLFYRRNPQEYRVYYLLDGTDTSDLSKLGEEADSANGVLLPVKKGTDAYGATVTATAETIGGMTCVSLLTQSIVLRQNNAQNVMIFFYTPLSYSVQYRAWEYGGGTFDVTQEVVTDAGSLRGSVPTANEGYEFAGWFLDVAGTIPADTKATVDAATNRLTPDKGALEPEPATNIFYAKFEPVFGSLTIRRENAEDQGNGSRVFVYKITAANDPNLTVYVTLTTDETGSGSVTVRDLGCLTYTVEQVNSWSWRYGDAAQTVTVVRDGSEVVFGDAAQNEHWLNGNSDAVQNRREGATVR